MCHKHQLLQGMTPLHYAAFDDLCEVGKLLLACGADRAAEDNQVCRLECHINAGRLAACKLQEQAKMVAAYQSYSLTVLAMTHMMHTALSGPWAPAVHCTKGVQLSVLVVCMAFTMHMPFVSRAS